MAQFPAPTGYQQEALRWLGLALIRDPNASLWEYAARQDPELAPIREILDTFLTNLQSVIPADPAQANEADAEVLVANALALAARSG